MSALQTLRSSPWLARLALLWLVMTLGVAVASPMVNPQSELMVCSAAGMIKLTVNADGSVSATPSSEAHCPLCMVGGAPPAGADQTFAFAQPLGHMLQSHTTAHFAARAVGLPPSRAPPSF